MYSYNHTIISIAIKSLFLRYLKNPIYYHFIRTLLYRVITLKVLKKLINQPLSGCLHTIILFLMECQGFLINKTWKKAVLDGNILS